jgi:ankyrin repeat protein
MTELIRAVHRGNLAEVNRLLAAGANPNTPDNNGDTPLMSTYRIVNNSSYTQIIDALLAAGADPNIRNNRGHAAIFYCRTDMVKKLVDAGANPNIQDNEGNTALRFVAESEEAEDFIEALLANGADPNIPDDEGNTPLMIAAANYVTYTVELLLTFGADPNMQNNEGETAIYSAAILDNIDIVRLLLPVSNIQTLQITGAGNKTMIELAKENAFSPEINTLILKPYKQRQVFNKIAGIEPGYEGKNIGTLKTIPQNVLKYVVGPMVGPKNGGRRHRHRKTKKRASRRRAAKSHKRRA